MRMACVASFAAPFSIPATVPPPGIYPFFLPLIRPRPFNILHDPDSGTIRASGRAS